jgi:2-oxoisovalerate dehydrogenase E2 component (dihydrolipoyl transacylase)
MSRHVVKLPDLGEGTVSSEIVAWHVKVGDEVQEEQPMVEMSTDKAVVEMPAPVSGRVVSLGGEPGDHIAVGAELIVLDTAVGASAQNASSPSAPSPTLPRAAGEGEDVAIAADGATTARKPPAATPARTPSNPQSAIPVSSTPVPSPIPIPSPAERGRVREGAAASAGREGASKETGAAKSGRLMASPATRRRARESGIDLTTVAGSGRDGRIQRQDLDAAINERTLGKAPATDTGRTESARRARTETEEIRILGVRRVSAQRVSDSKRNIPHFAYVEEVDVTELERLRKHLNSKLPKGTSSYTYLPFVAMALVRVIEQFPKCNAQFDAERNVLVQHRGVHMGIATQTSDGLKVPVIRHAETLSLREVAAEIRRLSEAARNGTASRNELRGSTITITSLGKLGGIVSTPIINAPEVAIIGVNKAIERPVVLNGAVTVRLMMNLSSSFDHRFIDGFDAAETIQALKEKLEQPATIFMAD